MINNINKNKIIMTLKQFKEVLEKYDLYDTHELDEVLHDHKYLCDKKLEELGEFNFILKHYKFEKLNDLHVFINKYHGHKCPEIVCNDCGDTVDESGCICPNTCRRESCDNYDEDEENDLCRDCNKIETKGILEELSDHNIYCLDDLKTFFNEFDKYLEKLNSKGINGFDGLLDKIDSLKVEGLNIGNNNDIIDFNDYIYNIRYKRKIFYHKKREDDINKLFDEKKNKNYKNDIENINIKYEKKDFIFNKTNISEIKETVLKKCKKSMERYKKLFNDVEYLYNEGIKMEKQVKTYFDKLKEKQETLDIFENEKLKELCNNYEKSLISETEFSRNIGELFVNNTLSKKDKKTFLSLNKNTRPSREITKCTRIYILEEFVSIKNIALSGISNWIRDCSEDKFELLLSLFNT